MLNLPLAGLVAALLLLVYRLVIKPLLNPFRQFPAPSQGPAYKRLLVEPDVDQLTQWCFEIPNEGFIKYHGILNSQKVLVTDPHAVHDILSTRPYSFIKPPPISKIIRSILGEGIIVVEGNAHKSQKRALQPAFKVRNIKDFYPVLERKTEELVSTLSTVVEMHAGNSSSSAIDLGTRLNQVTLDIIGHASFGLEFACLTDPENKLATDYAKGFAPSKEAQKYRMLALILPKFLLDNLPLKRNQELRTAIAAVRECASNVIEQRCAALNGPEKQSPGAYHKDILGMVMAESGVQDKETLINQSITILGAGHDTVHFTIETAIWEMVKNPLVQDRLRNEILSMHKATREDSDKQSDTVDIDNLPYLQAVCNETLRLHNSVPLLHRRSIEDVVIAGQAFPKGTTFMIPIRALNASPKLWKSDPLRFDPERWLEDPALGGATDRNAFMTFSAGARICIGQRFARAELKHLLAGLVAKYKFIWAGTGEHGEAQELKLEQGTTSRMIGGLWVKMELLDN